MPHHHEGPALPLSTHRQATQIDLPAVRGTRTGNLEGRSIKCQDSAKKDMGLGLSHLPIVEKKEFLCRVAMILAKSQTLSKIMYL